MKIGKDKVVSLTYELRLENAEGEMVQKVEKDRPFVYLFGVGGLLPAFEASLKDKGEGDSFAFGLTSEEACGPIEDEAVIALDKKIFEVDGKMDEELYKVGQVVPMQNDQGQPIHGVILEIAEETVTMDFNHPLAGKDLHFSGDILEVREATEEELEHGHAH